MNINMYKNICIVIFDKIIDNKEYKNIIFHWQNDQFSPWGQPRDSVSPQGVFWINQTHVDNKSGQFDHEDNKND